jgi:formylglycine-generating enzyme required for sulfatase activity
MRKLKVFVSSTMTELNDERAAVKRALEGRGIEVLWFEGLGAEPETAREAYLALVREANLYLGIFWNSYSGATKDEYQEAVRLNKPCLIYVKNFDVQREEELVELLDEIRPRHVYKSFGDVTQLQGQVQQDVLEWLVDRARRAQEALSDAGKERGIQEKADPEPNVAELQAQVEQLRKWIQAVDEDKLSSAAEIAPGSARRASAWLAETLRDPLWQGVGCVVTVLALAVTIGAWFWPDIRDSLFQPAHTAMPTFSVDTATWPVATWTPRPTVTLPPTTSAAVVMVPSTVTPTPVTPTEASMLPTETSTAVPPSDAPLPPTESSTPAPPTRASTPSTVTPTPATAQPVPYATRFREMDGAVMVYVPAGEFMMGSAEGEGYDEEHPQHTLYLSDFWIDQTEVTNEQYGLCVATGACSASRYADDDDFNGADQPVMGVSWYDAQAYCQWLSEETGQGYRLPTEAEWEKAARGMDGRKYPWGNAFDSGRLNFCDANCDLDWQDSRADDSYQYTAPVGSYPAGASPYGALDMAGNVWEWCSTEFRDYRYDPDDGREALAASGNRLLRGGSWFRALGFARCACRFGVGPNNRNDDMGFRVVASTGSP